MTRYRLHLFPPAADDVSVDEDEFERRDAELTATFEEYFTRTDGAPIQDMSREWVSEVFEEEPDEMDRLEEFKAECRRIFPESNLLQTRQDRDVIDGRAEEQGYDEAIILQVSYAIS